MNKIEFKNFPDLTTPLSANNLNQLQDNVEDVFDGTVAMGNINTTGIKINNTQMRDFISGYMDGSQTNGWIIHTWANRLGECFKKMTITLGSTSGNYGQEGYLYWAYAEFDLPQNYFNQIPITTVTISKANGRGAYFVIDPANSTKNKIKGWVYSSRDIHGEDVDFNIHCVGQ